MKKIPLVLSLVFLVHYALGAEPRTPDSAVTPVDDSRHPAFLNQIKAAKGDFGFLLIGDSIADFWPNCGKECFFL